jgi:hypothetical protein
MTGLAARVVTSFACRRATELKLLTSRQLLSWFSPWDSRTIHAALTCPSTSCTKIEAGAAISMDVICAQLGSDGHDSQ